MMDRRALLIVRRKIKKFGYGDNKSHSHAFPLTPVPPFENVRLPLSRTYREG